MQRADRRVYGPQHACSGLTREAEHADLASDKRPVLVRVELDQLIVQRLPHILRFRSFTPWLILYLCLRDSALLN